MMTRLGSGICERWGIHDGAVCFDRRNMGCHIVVEPESHGSKRMEKEPGGCWYGGPGGVFGEVSVGEKVRRKVVSPLRCLTVKDMMMMMMMMIGKRSSARLASWFSHSINNIPKLQQGAGRIGLKSKRSE